MFRVLQTRTSAAGDSRTRRGAIVVLAAVMMIVFLASVVFSVDVSYMQLTKAKLRAATDAAARAAGEGLSRAQDLNYARQAAKDIAAANKVAGKPLVLDDSDIVFGKSDQQSSGAWTFTPNGQPINAVRVFGRRTREAPSGSVPLFFGRVFNVLDFEPVQAATVVRLDRDICLVVDRSSSMKFYLTDPGGAMPTNDPRFCQPPNMNLSRWGALSVAVQRFVDALAQTPQSEYVALVSYAGGSNGASSYNSSSCGPSFSSNTVSGVGCAFWQSPRLFHDPY
ncbi:MAG: TadG family pilus assembly protein, partial [Pirellulales bacterium]